MQVSAIVPAAGKGRRLGKALPKPFVLFFGKPLFIHTLRNLKKAYPFKELIVALDPAWIRRGERMIRQQRLRGVRVVAGGRTRAESVRNALGTVSAGLDWVLVHDAARPLVTRPLVRRLLKEAKKSGAAICVEPLTSTLKKVDLRRGSVIRTEDRNRFFSAQTPQVFKRQLLIQRYQELGHKALAATDEASLFEGSRIRVRVVHGEAKNIKVTTREDLALLRFYAKGR